MTAATANCSQPAILIFAYFFNECQDGQAARPENRANQPFCREREVAFVHRSQRPPPPATPLHAQPAIQDTDEILNLHFLRVQKPTTGICGKSQPKVYLSWAITLETSKKLRREAQSELFVMFRWPTLLHGSARSLKIRPSSSVIYYLCIRLSILEKITDQEGGEGNRPTRSACSNYKIPLDSMFASRLRDKICCLSASASHSLVTVWW